MKIQVEKYGTIFTELLYVENDVYINTNKKISSYSENCVWFILLLCYLIFPIMLIITPSRRSNLIYDIYFCLKFWHLTQRLYLWYFIKKCLLILHIFCLFWYIVCIVFTKDLDIYYDYLNLAYTVLFWTFIRPFNEDEDDDVIKKYIFIVLFCVSFSIPFIPPFQFPSNSHLYNQTLV